MVSAGYYFMPHVTNYIISHLTVSIYTDCNVDVGICLLSSVCGKFRRINKSVEFALTTDCTVYFTTQDWLQVHVYVFA